MSPDKHRHPGPSLGGSPPHTAPQSPAQGLLSPTFLPSLCPAHSWLAVVPCCVLGFGCMKEKN